MNTRHALQEMIKGIPQAEMKRYSLVTWKYIKICKTLLEVRQIQNTLIG